MSAEHAVRRKRTAREIAEQLGVSPRTVRRFVAEPRDDYLSRAEQRRQQIRDLREQGLSIRAIANKVGCSVGTVHNALKDHSKGTSSDHVAS